LLVFPLFSLFPSWSSRTHLPYFALNELLPPRRTTPVRTASASRRCSFSSPQVLFDGVWILRPSLDVTSLSPVMAALRSPPPSLEQVGRIRAASFLHFPLPPQSPVSALPVLLGSQVITRPVLSSGFPERSSDRPSGPSAHAALPLFFFVLGLAPQRDYTRLSFPPPSRF